MTRGTAYYYVVQASNATGGTSVISNEASADIINTSSPYYQINAGGPASAPFAGDSNNTSANRANVANTINVTAPNSAPAAIYQTDRYGGTGSPFTYTLPGLTANGNYIVRLHFAETFFSSPSQREFNVAINGTQVLTNFDIFAAAGAANKAVVRNFNVTADGSGTITLIFSLGAVNFAKVSGLEVYSGSVTSAPSGLSVSATNAQNVLTWTAPSSGTATSYNLYRSTSAGTEGSTPYQTGLTGTTYTDTGLTNGTTYYYTLAAVNANGESAASNEASGGPNAPPSVPTSPVATPGNASVALTWTASTGAGTITYNVLRSTTPGGSYSLIGTSASASYTDGTAANNTTYYYVIQGANNGGSSANSSEVSATPGGTSGLLGWWKFDENTGTSVSDASGYSNTGTFSNGAWGTGRSGYAGSFNGTSSAVNMGKGLIATANSFSVSCWVKMNSTSGFQTFVSQDGSSGSGFYLQKLGTTGKFGFSFLASDSNVAATTTANGTTTPTTGVWYHLIGVYDRPNSLLSLYVNGTLEGTASFTTPWSAAGVTAIGRAFYNSTQTDWVNGAIDGVRLYNRVMTAAEIATYSAYPTGVTATSTTSSATVSWSAFTNATSYNLYRSTTAGSEGGTGVPNRADRHELCRHRPDQWHYVLLQTFRCDCQRRERPVQ